MTTIPKERIDVLLVERGYYDSREKAKKALMAGLVLVDDEPVDKSGMKVPRSADIKVKGALHPYVSRGGLKLEKAIKSFGIDMTGRVMLDIGASTGGFTDCALQNGASFVYAIDVGYNQLDWSLRQHEQVRVMERTNFRYMLPEHLEGPRPDFASIDVSFISLKHILPTLATLLPQNAGVVALIKPQFEAGREKVGKLGVVRDPSVHAEVIRQVLGYASEAGFSLRRLTYSPITGGEGNIEFLAYWETPLTLDSASAESAISNLELTIVELVAEANRTFKGKP
ncbi:MAG: hemolysin [Paenibacillus sp.]|jgi:23S rRNA (cytidine1920-2'-O)/16S rRNA (cytidine1409-2'-O)-methyltransferase|nr:hemolysin [Paenibacillus sp.]